MRQIVANDWTFCLLLYLAGVILCLPVTVGILVGKISNILLARLMCSAKLIVSAHTHSCQEPIDSGAEKKHDRSLVKELSISLIPLSESLQVSTLNGTRLPGKNSLFLFDAPNTPLALGFLWLNTHNPNTDLLKGRISGWSLWPKELAITQSSPAELPNLTSFPDLAEVFKDLALSLRAYSLYDCGIDFLPGALLPTSHLYSLLMPARTLIEKYFMNSLAACFVFGYLDDILFFKSVLEHEVHFPQVLNNHLYVRGKK